MENKTFKVQIKNLYGYSPLTLWEDKKEKGFKKVGEEHIWIHKHCIEEDAFLFIPQDTVITESQKFTFGERIPRSSKENLERQVKCMLGLDTPYLLARSTDGMYFRVGFIYKVKDYPKKLKLKSILYNLKTQSWNVFMEEAGLISHHRLEGPKKVNFKVEEIFQAINDARIDRNILDIAKLKRTLGIE